MLLRNVTLLWAIVELDKKSYYPLKIAEKSCCATVLFWDKIVTMQKNRYPFLKGVAFYHYHIRFRVKKTLLGQRFLPPIFQCSQLP